MKKEKPHMFVPTLIFLAFLIIILCFYWGASIVEQASLWGLKTEDTSIGDWGDSFSALNSAFSGLALLGVGATVYLQMRFARRQQIEIGKAEFERVFFQLFRLIRELRTAIKYSPTSAKGYRMKGSASVSATADLLYGPPEKLNLETVETTVSSTDAIKLAYNTILNRAESIFTADQVNEKQASRLYRIVINRRHEPDFSPYFRAIYSLLKKIDTNPFLDDDERLDYSRLLRSQMTSHEVALLGLNGLTKDAKDLKDYICKYRMLKYAQDGKILDILRQTYPPETFKGR